MFSLRSNDYDLWNVARFETITMLRIKRSPQRYEVIPMHRLKRHVAKVAHHPAFQHTHHVVYIAYYAFACVEEHGVKLLLGGSVLTCAAIIALGGLFNE